MMKALLTSAGFENPAIGAEFLRLVDKPAREIRVLFIPAAAVTEEQLGQVDASREELIRFGLRPKNIVTLELNAAVTYDQVKDFDAVYVCGGNPLHLLDQMIETRFDAVLKQLIAAGAIYVGVSAGSIVIGPKVADETGLRIIKTIVMPHYETKLRERLRWLEEQTGYLVTPLADHQALRIDGNQYAVIE
jgi:peptidase E